MRIGECLQCGNCCKFVAFALHPDDLESPETQEFYAARGLPIIDSMVCVPHVCPHLGLMDDRKLGCDLHANKSQACKDFPWNETCLPKGCGYRFVDDV